MLCTYTHDIYKKFSDMNDPNAVAYHKLNIRELKEYFDKQNKMPLKDRVNIILMLFPVNDKNELVINLHNVFGICRVFEVKYGQDNRDILEVENVEIISCEQSFKIVSYCTQLLSQHSAEAELSARKIVIHVLNNWGKLMTTYMKCGRI